MTPQQVALLALFWGFLGAIFGLLASSAIRALSNAVFDSEWFADYSDRLYVKQAGRISLPALLAVAVGLVVYLSACAAPEPRFTGSDVWYERVVKGGW